MQCWECFGHGCLASDIHFDEYEETSLEPRVILYANENRWEVWSWRPRHTHAHGPTCVTFMSCSWGQNNVGHVRGSWHDPNYLHRWRKTAEQFAPSGMHQPRKRTRMDRSDQFGHVEEYAQGQWMSTGSFGRCRGVRLRTTRHLWSLKSWSLYTQLSTCRWVQ